MATTLRQSLMLLSVLVLAACGPVEDGTSEPTDGETSEALWLTTCPAASTDGCAGQPVGSACVTSSGGAATCQLWGSKSLGFICSCF